MVLGPFWRSTLLGFVVVLALLAEEGLELATSADSIDCRYENPELHRYMERIDICSP